MDKKSAFNAHLSAKKRVTLVTQQYASDKKAAITPPIFNYSATKNRRYFAFGLWYLRPLRFFLSTFVVAGLFIISFS